MCVSSVGFALGVLRGVLGEYAVLSLSKLKRFYATDLDLSEENNVFYLRLGSTSIGHARHVKTRNDNGLRIWIFLQKLPFSVGKKCFRDKFRKYNTLYLYVI